MNCIALLRFGLTIYSKKVPSAAIDTSRRLQNRQQAVFICIPTLMPLYYGNQRVLGVVSLPVDK